MLTLSCTINRRMTGFKVPKDLHNKPIYAKSIRKESQCALGRVLPCTQLATQRMFISIEEEESTGWSMLLTHFSSWLPRIKALE